MYDVILKNRSFPQVAQFVDPLLVACGGTFGEVVVFANYWEIIVVEIPLFWSVSEK